MPYQTVAEAVLAAVAAEEFPWVDWEPGLQAVIDSNGNPVIDSNGNPVYANIPYGYVLETNAGNYWSGSYANGLQIVASTGPENPAPDTVAVPNVVGLTIAQARAAIAAVNLSTSGFTWAASSEAGGTVTAQSPAAAAQALPGSPVSLTLSLGASP